MANQAAGAWADKPESIPNNCPPGLEYLLHVDQLLVKQTVELLEAFTGFETANKYKVLNSMGQQVFAAAEDSGCCNRQCCGPIREFDMALIDNNGSEVARFHRPLNCTCRCITCYCPCCLQQIDVMASGQTVGKIIQRQKLINCNPVFEVR